MTTKTTKKSSDAAQVERLLQLYDDMVFVRTAEQMIGRLFADGHIPGFIHLSIGQESIAAGVCPALECEDTMTTHHRGHGHSLLKGMDLKAFFYELMSKEEGICHGRAGSMHLADMSVGIIGANGLIGQGLPISLGSAFALKQRGTRNLSVAFFGDGALAAGSLHESFNIASLWKLPLLVVLENNGWAEFTPVPQVHFAGTIGKVASAFGIPAVTVDAADVLAVADAANEIVRRIRLGGGPHVLECLTQRLRGHYEGDPQKYREKADLEQARAKDPVECCHRRLIAAGLSSAELEAVQTRHAETVDAAAKAALQGTVPSFRAAMDDVYRKDLGGRLHA